jgi:hypothetical protein
VGVSERETNGEGMTESEELARYKAEKEVLKVWNQTKNIMERVLTGDSGVDPATAKKVIEHLNLVYGDLYYEMMPKWSIPHG